MPRNVSKIFIKLLCAGCSIVHFFIVLGCDWIVGCYRSFFVQALLTILENACFDVTGKVYYVSGAVVGTAEGLWLIARHVSSPFATWDVPSETNEWMSAHLYDGQHIM